MTRKEKELKVLEAFGLKVGDKIKTETNILIIEDSNDSIVLRNKEDDSIIYNPTYFLMEDWKKIQPSLKDKRCKKDFIDCQGCPILNKYTLDCTNVNFFNEKTLEEIYKTIKKDLDTAKKEIFGDEE